MRIQLSFGPRIIALPSDGLMTQDFGSQPVLEWDFQFEHSGVGREIPLLIREQV
jgi:hypothetical protein